MLTVIMLTVIMLTVIMLTVILLTLVAPSASVIFSYLSATPSTELGTFWY
jgi:hypothetical protein